MEPAALMLDEEDDLQEVEVAKKSLLLSVHCIIGTELEMDS